MFLDFDFKTFAAFLDFYTNSLWSSGHQFTGFQMCPGTFTQGTMALNFVEKHPFFRLPSVHRSLTDLWQTAAALSEIPTQSCSDLLWRVSSREQPGRGTLHVVPVTWPMAVCQLPTTHWLIIKSRYSQDVCHCVPKALGTGPIASDPHIVRRPRGLMDKWQRRDVSVPRCLMWRPLTFGWRCVSCLCSLPCWSTLQSTLSRGNTRSSSGWGKSSGSRG